MAYESCIPKTPGSRFSILREDYFAICDENGCAARLLAFFEHRHNSKLDNLRAHINFCEEHNIPYKATDESYFYLTHSQADLVKTFIEPIHRTTVAKAINLLEDKGFIKVVGWPAHLNHLPYRYLFQADAVVQQISQYQGVDSKTTTQNHCSSERQISDNIVDSKTTTKEVESFKNSLSKDKQEQAPRVTLLKRRVVQEASKPTLLKRENSLPFVSLDVRTLFRHWNNLGYPVKSHREDHTSKMFNKANEKLAKMLHKYTVKEIQDAMTNYHRILVHDNTILNLAVTSLLVNILDFFEFNQYSDKALSKIPAFDGVNSWFEECHKGWEYLLQKFEKPAKFIPDAYPEVSKELAKQYREKINPTPFTTSEINTITRASVLLVNYHETMKGKINFTACGLEKNSVKIFSRRMIEAIIDCTPDLSIVQVSWLASENQFKVRLTGYLQKLGMISKDHQGSVADVMTPELKEQRKNEIEAAKEENRARQAALWASDLSEEEKNKQQGLLITEIKAKIEEISEKYKQSHQN